MKPIYNLRPVHQKPSLCSPITRHKMGLIWLQMILQQVLGKISETLDTKLDLRLNKYTVTDFPKPISEYKANKTMHSYK